MNRAKLNLQVVVDELFSENAYIAQLDGRSDCLLFDPSFDVEGLVEHLEKHNLQPAAVLNTHGHADHIAGNEAIKQRWPDCPLVIGSGDAVKLTDPVQNLSRTYGFDVTSPAADELVNEGDSYTAAGFTLEVLETPGHSSGHVVFVWKGQQPWIVFGGDVLFQGSVGRTDFPDGNMDQLAASIRNKLYTLPDDTIVLPGHGGATTVGEEKRFNPFVLA